MPLKTDSFGFTRYWMVAACKELPRQSELFAAKNLSLARKTFLAGSNQLTAIKNWLKAGAVTESRGSNTTLTEFGQLVAAQDPRAESAWTWWLFHLHLCVNVESFPYSTFFLLYDSEGRWMSLDDIVTDLFNDSKLKGNQLSQDSVETYFRGVANTFQTGEFVHELGLIEERSFGDRGKKVRRRLSRPEDAVVAYAAVLFQKQYYPGQPTVEVREILGKGLARVLGIRDPEMRESLSRISTHKDLSQYVQYRQQVNQDSLQFLKPAETVLKDMRINGYRSQSVKWQ